MPYYKSPIHSDDDKNDTNEGDSGESMPEPIDDTSG